MKRFQVALLFSLLCWLTIGLQAQNLRENEIVVIKGEKYILHQVRTGETIFSIARDFKIDRERLIENNPEISSGLNIGQIIKIPYNPAAAIEEKPLTKKDDPARFITYQIESRRETPFFIAKKFGITVEELYAYNPEVKRFRRGDKIRIPMWDAVTEEIAGTVDRQDEKSGEQGSKGALREHLVSPGETLYSISKKYGVPESEILFQNPGAENLKAGSKIFIPVHTQHDQYTDDIGVETAGEQSYFEHIIESGETMWGITHRYNVSQEELIALNPFLKEVFPKGAVIKIPVKEKTALKSREFDPGSFSEHTVEKGETLFGLARKYQVSVTEIKNANPVLELRNLIEGEKILIPLERPEQPENTNLPPAESSYPKPYVKPEITVKIPASCKGQPGWNNSQEYRIALFLPLYLQANDTLNRMVVPPDTVPANLMEMSQADTLVEHEEPKELFRQFYGNSENFLQFYEGVLIAADSMQKAGMRFSLAVFDTQNNADTVRKYLNRNDMTQFDLIIGPVYDQVQDVVSQVSKNNRIPMISPFSSRSEHVNTNPYFYQLNPGRDYLMERTAEMVADEYYNGNIIVLKTSEFSGTPEERLVNLVREKLINSGSLNSPGGSRFLVYDFKNEGAFGLRRILASNRENVVIIPSNVAGELSVAISNLNNLADDFSITLIGTGNLQQRFPSIEVDHFHNLKLKFVYPYWTDFDAPQTIDLITKFRKNFACDPNSFGIQGYDAAMYFLNALYFFGKDFNDCLPYFHVGLVQGNYHFEKVSAGGGFMNRGVSVISYKPDFTVKRERVVGQPRLIAVN